MSHILYYSYGSNMSRRRLVNRVPSAQAVGVARLYEHNLCFHKIGKDNSGKCDAHHTGNLDNYVIGVVYRFLESEKPLLDSKEGLGYGYLQKDVSVITDDKTKILAFTYYASSIEPGLTPYHWYKHHVLHGAQQHKLPHDYIKQIELVDSIADPDAVRHAHELSIYR